MRQVAHWRELFQKDQAVTAKYVECYEAHGGFPRNTEIIRNLLRQILERCGASTGFTPTMKYVIVDWTFL
jgi:hypothetical protein